MQNSQQIDFIEVTSNIVAPYVSNNAVPLAELPTLISDVFLALARLNGKASPVTSQVPLKPIVPIKKTVTDDYIVSLEDGKQYRTLRRHLGTLGLSPEAYRAKWNLPSDYPMSAVNYTKARSEQAKQRGLGLKANPVGETAKSKLHKKTRAKKASS